MCWSATFRKLQTHQTGMKMSSHALGKIRHRQLKLADATFSKHLNNNVELLILHDAHQSCATRFKPVQASWKFCTSTLVQLKSTYMWNWPDLQMWKLTCSSRPTDLQIPIFAKFFGNLYTWSMHFGGSTGFLASWTFMELHTCGSVGIHILHISCIYMLSSHPIDPHMCQPTQYFPTCFHIDLISPVNLYIQTCRSVQISENAYPGSLAPPEL